MEFLRLLHRDHLLEVLPFIGAVIHLSLLKYRAKARRKEGHSDRLTARRAECPSTEIYEIAR